MLRLTSKALWRFDLLNYFAHLVPFYLSNWFNDWIIYTARGIGESCNNSIQCEAKTPYSTCDTDKRCRCEQGYLALNDSCSPGIPLIYRNLVPILFILYFVNFTPLMITFTLYVNIPPFFIRATTQRYMWRFHTMFSNQPKRHLRSRVRCLWVYRRSPSYIKQMHQW